MAPPSSLKPYTLDASVDALGGKLFLLDHGVSDVTARDVDIASRRDSTYRRLLGVGDMLATIAALCLTLVIVNQSVIYWSMFSAVLMVVPSAKLMGLYDRDAQLLNHTTLDEFPRIATLALLVGVGAAIARDLALSGPPLISVPMFLTLVLLLALSLTVARVTMRWIARMVTPPQRLLAVGSAEDADDLIRRIEHANSIRAEVVGRISIDWDEIETGRADVVGDTRDLRRAIDAYKIDRLVVMPGHSHSEVVSEVVRAVRSVGVKISLMPRLFDAIGFAIEPDDVGGMQLMGVRDFQMTSSSSLIKRTTDIIGAGVALALLSPVFAICALWVKLDSSGPVFYRQRRIGRGGKPFEILKFRTMHAGADSQKDALEHLNEASGLFKIADDPRITRAGKPLRALALDELPQLINVLRGDMSLVGPRPLVPAEDEAITGWYRRRSQITPGITGVWQLLGPVRIPLDEMVKMDYLYVANWSWWGDVKILLRTVPYVAGRRGV